MQAINESSDVDRIAANNTMKYTMVGKLKFHFRRDPLKLFSINDLNKSLIFEIIIWRFVKYGDKSRKTTN